jgi:type IV pilus assembly protein PilE
MKKLNAGFTLLELMMTVAIVGILVAISLPSYNAFTQRARCANAAGVLLESANIAERRRLETGSYAGAPVPSTSDGGHYSIVLSGADADSFTLTATASDGSAVLTVTETGATTNSSDMTCFPND